MDHVWKPIINETKKIDSKEHGDVTKQKDSIIFFNSYITTLTPSNNSNTADGNIPLLHFIRKYTNQPLSTYIDEETNQKETVLQVLLSDLYDVLGMIRSLQYDIQYYNQSIPLLLSSSSSNEANNTNPTNSNSNNNKVRYYQYRFLQQLQICCPTNIIRNVMPNETIRIYGLNELIPYIETYYSNEIQNAQQQINIEQQISFSSMMEYCRPGTILIDTGMITGCNNTNMAVKCRSNRYRRSKTAFGNISTCHEVSIEFIIALGIPPSTSTTTSTTMDNTPHYAIIETIWIQSEYDTIRSIQYDNTNPNAMLLLPNPSILEELRQRGILYQSYCYNNTSSSGVYVNYGPGTFYPCYSTIRKSSSSSNSTYSHSSNNYQPSRNGGRMMIDIYQSYIRGIHICKPPADSSIASDIILQTFQSYLRYIRKTVQQQQQQSTSTAITGNSNQQQQLQPQYVPDDIMVLNGPMIVDDHDNMICMTWPVVCGFSFTTRQWGIVTIEGLSHISNYADTVFDTLVLAPSRKRLLRAIVSNYHHNRTNSNSSTLSSSSSDVLPGKGEGLIILLHGPPGVGKTLTAEAVSEVLHRPLYRVSMGELGTTPDHLEEKLQDIFDLCLPWSAIVLIDEAELLLRTREVSDDLIRNAMVCVMLRLLEYYPGILFLTTNSHMDQLDPAIVSRITVALEYNALDTNSRKEIWRNSISRVLQNTSNSDSRLSYNDEHILSDRSLSILATQYSTLNGRQIKNAVQLASILYHYEQKQDPKHDEKSLVTMITLDCIHEVLEMTVSK